MIKNNLISISNENKLTTTSLKIAEYFGKFHKNVISKIEKLKVSKEFNQLNFKPVEYIDSKGQKRPMYEITKDGFVFLTMGFTGKLASKFKEEYIEAFNKMEKALNKKIQQTTKPMSQIDILQAMIDQFKAQEQRILTIENKIESIEHTPKNITVNISKVKDLKSFNKMKKTELGRSINYCVDIISKKHGMEYNESEYRSQGAFYAEKHHLVRDIYTKKTGKVYLGTTHATVEDKKEYSDWLLEYCATI